MTKYAETATKAAELVLSGNEPEEAWKIASCDIFEAGSWSQTKSCPKNAFLGLYREDLNNFNAGYAKKALNYLRNNKNHVINENELWDIVCEGNGKSYNSQMHVVLALWNAGYIE